LGDDAERRGLLARLDELRETTSEPPWTLGDLLDVAYPAASARGDRHLGFEHMVVAWAAEPHGPVHGLLDENGLRERMLAAY
jgi:hypothetical protein